MRWGRLSTIGVVVAALGILWLARGELAFGGVAAAIGATCIGLRLWRPRYVLVIATPRQALLLRVAAGSLAEANALVTAHGRTASSLPQATAR